MRPSPLPSARNTPGAPSGLDGHLRYRFAAFLCVVSWPRYPTPTRTASMENPQAAPHVSPSVRVDLSDIVPHPLHWDFALPAPPTGITAGRDGQHPPAGLTHADPPGGVPNRVKSALSPSPLSSVRSTPAARRDTLLPCRTQTRRVHPRALLGLPQGEAVAVDSGAARLVAQLGSPVTRKRV